MKARIFIVSALLFLILPFRAYPVSITESVAIISDYEGEVLIKQINRDFSNVNMNMPVYEGADIKTGPGSFVEITMDDATITS